MVNDVNALFDPERGSPGDFMGSWTIFPVHRGAFGFHGRRLISEVTTMHVATTTGIPDIYGNEHFSKRACTGSYGMLAISFMGCKKEGDLHPDSQAG